MSTIERLEKLLAEATPGPWRANWGDVNDSGLTKLIASQAGPLGRTSPDVMLMVEARNMLPALLRVAKAAEAIDGDVAECDGEFLMAELHEALAALDAVKT